MNLGKSHVFLNRLLYTETNREWGDTYSYFNINALIIFKKLLIVVLMTDLIKQDWVTVHLIVTPFLFYYSHFIMITLFYNNFTIQMSHLLCLTFKNGTETYFSSAFSLPFYFLKKLYKCLLQKNSAKWVLMGPGCLLPYFSSCAYTSEIVLLGKS
jgi:hypothetical protein